MVCDDDKQIVKLIVYKLFDSEGSCDGRTVVELTKFDERVDFIG